MRKYRSLVLHLNIYVFRKLNCWVISVAIWHNSTDGCSDSSRGPQSADVIVRVGLALTAFLPDQGACISHIKEICGIQKLKNQ
jgi:hypothetical protein